MRFIGAPEVRTDSFGKLLGRKHPVGFDDMALAVDPFGFNGIEPRTLRGQEEGQDADPHRHQAKGQGGYNLTTTGRSRGACDDG